MGANAVLGTEDKHALQEVDAELVDLREDGTEVLGGVHLEVGLVLGELGDAGPGALGGGAHYTEDADDLVLVGCAGEQGPTRVHLGHDAAGGPDIDAGVVGAAAEKDVGGAIPEGDDLVGEGVDGDAEGAGEAKIAEFELTLGVDEQVLGFKVAVQDPVLVAEVDALEQLVHERLDGHRFQSAPLAVGVHVLLKVAVHELEDEHKFVLGVDDVVQRYDVLMFQLLHEGDLADRGRWCAFLRIEVYLLERYKLACLAIPTFEYSRISTFA